MVKFKTNIFKVLERSEESKERWIEDGRGSERCEWMVVERKRDEEKMAEYFEELLNVQEDREADIVAVGGVQVPVMGKENERDHEKGDEEGIE